MKCKVSYQTIKQPNFQISFCLAKYGPRRASFVGGKQGYKSLFSNMFQGGERMSTLTVD